MSASPAYHVSKTDRQEPLDMAHLDTGLSDGDDAPSERPAARTDAQLSPQLPHLHVDISAPEDTSMDHEQPSSRSASATSSLDPYYFGIQSESETQSPTLAVPATPLHPSSTPDHDLHREPVTPARNPAAIDRRGLVGVPELATPRWAHHEKDTSDRENPTDQEIEGYDVVAPNEVEEDDPDSPWTIEAIDGESSEREDVPQMEAPPRKLRTRPSMADESGGEEILYPRNPNVAGVPEMPPKPTFDFTSSDDQTPKLSRVAERSDNAEGMSPPSAFSQTSRRARKRTSDEFILDQTGALVSKGTTKPKEDKGATRKHRSLNVNTSVSLRAKDRKRDSVGVVSSKSSPAVSKVPERHVRQTSTGSTSSNPPDSLYARRLNPTDFSHLPPSPASSSIQQFLRHPPPTSPPQYSPGVHSPRDAPLHASASVAHSLLRGTQEGWQDLNDEATAEALRKLDGLTGKSARARASVGSFRQASGSSRPGTPPTKAWGDGESAKAKRNTSGSVKDTLKPEDGADQVATAISSDEQPVASLSDKTPKKTGTRLSFTPKRGSTSSTTYTSTPSSRDSASMSATTSGTSVSGASGRQSLSKVRRNSAGSDISSIHSTDIKDRVASMAMNGDGLDVLEVPPVPPLPKGLSGYRPQPSAPAGIAFPSSYDDKPVDNPTPGRPVPVEVPVYTSPVISSPPHTADRRDSQYYSSSANESAQPNPVVTKTPSKKWSISNALNKLASSPSTSSSKSSFPLSPRGMSFGQQLRKSTSKDLPQSSSAKVPWTPDQPNAMASDSSLVSLSSIGSSRTPAQPFTTSKTPDKGLISSRPGTSSSASTSHTTSALSAPQPPPNPLSPSASVRRGHSKRLTPSSIPFFRRSSSQSMQVPPPPAHNISATSPTLQSSMSTPRKQRSPIQEYSSSMSTSTPGTSSKRSVLSLGLPSLLKSSSRRSLHADAKEAAKESREAEKERQKQEKERQKKEDKDRSESRISVIINRKRGKTLSSTDPRKPKSPVNLPPMQISAIEPVTAHRVAKLKSSVNSNPSSRASVSSTSSRLTSATVSSMQKQSDSSLRSRTQLPTIAGSPSVATNSASSSQTMKDRGDGPPSALNTSVSGIPKETPTKIPRISSRTSAAASPPLKHSTSAANRRTSTLAPSANASPTSLNTSEWGVIDDDNSTPKVKGASARSSPLNTSTSRGPRQPLVAQPSQRKSRDSVSFMGLRKSSGNSSGLNTATAPPEQQQTQQPQHHHRLSILSPSKGLKLLQPKTSSRSSTMPQPSSSPSSSGRQSLSTPSPVPSAIDEEEMLGDEEMMAYIRRQHAKKLASGASQESLDEMLKFPEPLPPGVPSSPNSILRGPHAAELCEFEKREIQDYPSVYCWGAGSKKVMASPDHSTNNYGYDDERGDYQVVEGDHLAFRYEVMDTLGKGSFGQVLRCRDHCTGEAVAVKIIRNKKRFHHQALVEIKILDNLRKWDAEEKHHVIKMTEHFYFRSHLCIATELLSINLYELIKANGFVGFTTSLIRRFTSQMLMSLSLMRHHRIVHCDLKPENVLLRHPAKSGIKVIDFGSSCFEHEKIYTYIQSRFYRSPEVILGMNYHMAIDMWSLGCILAELFTGFPIFPGENEQEQLSCIMEVLGTPDKEFIARSSRRKLFFDTNGTPRTVINSKGRRRRPGTKTLAQVLRCNDEEFVDFVSKCLVWDPERRMKPQAAMRHPFMFAGRRQQQPTGVPTRSTASTTGFSNTSRSKAVPETPKKSLISAPTPLTARSSRTAAGNGLTTPNTSVQHAQALTSSVSQSSRSYRSSQTHSLSFGSSRTLNGYTSSSTKGG